MKFLKKAISLSLAALLLVSMLPVSAAADCVEGCTEGNHVDGCSLYVVPCTGQAGCAATTHAPNCYVELIKLCSHSLGCPASVHHGDCQQDALNKCSGQTGCSTSVHQPTCAQKVYNDKLALCTHSIGCGAEVHHSDCQEVILRQCTTLASCANSLHYDTCQKKLDDEARLLCSEAADCTNRLHKPTCKSLCGNSAACTSLAHKDTCIKLCTGYADCSALTHTATCLTHCSTRIDCPATVHKSGCAKAEAEAALAAANSAKLTEMLNGMLPWLEQNVMTKADYKTFQTEWETVNKFAQDNGITPNAAQTALFERLSKHLTTVATDIVFTFYDSDKTTVLDTATGELNTNVVLPKDPTKTGYTFVRWEDILGKEAVFPAKFPNTNMAFYAKWNINQYTIVFDTVGGTSIATITGDYGKTITPAISTTRTGYRFVKWIDELGQDAAAPASIPAKDTVLKAVWTPIEYKIAFDKNGGNGGDMATRTVPYDTIYPLPANAFTHATHRFAGWNTKADGTGDSYPDASTIKNLSATQDEVITLYAMWTDKNTLNPDLNVKKTVTYSGQPHVYTYPGFDVKYYVNGTFTSVAPTDAGHYDIEISAPANTATNTAAYRGVIHDGLVIEPALLTATYVGDWVYAGYAPALKVVVSGFVGGETAATATGYVHPVVVAPNKIGTYTLAPFGGAAKNYVFNYVPGTLYIVERVIYVWCPYKLLQTGQLNWPVPVMGIFGSAAMTAGLWFLLRKKKESYEER